MQRDSAYKIARYTSWIALIISLIGLIWGADSEGIIFGLIIVGPFISLPWIIFLAALYVTKRWNNLEKSIMVMLVALSFILLVSGIYIAFQNGIFELIDAVIILVAIIIGGESINILNSN